MSPRLERMTRLRLQREAKMQEGYSEASSEPPAGEPHQCDQDQPPAQEKCKAKQIGHHKERHRDYGAIDQPSSDDDPERRGDEPRGQCSDEKSERARFARVAERAKKERDRESNERERQSRVEDAQNERIGKE